MTVVSPEPMGSELAISDRQTRFSHAQRVALAHMGVDKAPDEDVDVFFHVCQRTRLDPFARQIYMIGRPESVMVDGEWTKQMKYTIQTGIDGYRTIARRTAKGEDEELEYADTLWCGRDGVWHDVWLGEPQDLMAAKATVIRGGKRFTHVALWREYVQTKRNGEPNTMWATKGANQLAKCAEAGALRKAYPQDYAGLYVDAEMEHLASDAAAEQVVQGGRDWWADADAATTVDELRQVWSEAHRHGVLRGQLKEHMEQRKTVLVTQNSEPVASEPILEAEVIDETTGEITTPAPQPQVKQATVRAIIRELERCGVAPGTADSYLSAFGIPRERITDLTQDEAAELLVACKALTRDDLVEMMAQAAGAER